MGGGEGHRNETGANGKRWRVGEGVTHDEPSWVGSDEKCRKWSIGFHISKIQTTL